MRVESGGEGGGRGRGAGEVGAEGKERRLQELTM